MKKILRVILFSLILLLGVSDAHAQRFSETVWEQGFDPVFGVRGERLGSMVLYIDKKSVTVINGNKSVKYKILSKASGTMTTYDHLNKCFDFWIIEPAQVQRIWVNRKGFMQRIFYLNRV